MKAIHKYHEKLYIYIYIYTEKQKKERRRDGRVRLSKKDYGRKKGTDI